MAGKHAGRADRGLRSRRALWATSAIGSRWPTCSTCSAGAGRGARSEGAACSADRTASARVGRLRLAGAFAISPACRPRRRRPTTPPQSIARKALAAEAANDGQERPAGCGRGAAGRARDGGRRAVDEDLRSLGTAQPLHLSIQCALRRGIFLPVANDYRRLPPPIRSGVHNFFGNLAEIDSIINYVAAGTSGPRWCAAWDGS